MDKEVIILNEERNVSLTCYIQPVGGEFSNITKRPAMIVLPGGGYSMCSDREADPVAFEYMKAGYQTFILRYSVAPHATWPNPMNDYDQAYEYILSRADEWNIYTDKIAVVGFSAGGHMAATAATLAKHRPAAAVLGYAVVEDETAKMCSPTAPDLVSEVDEKTPPCFLFATRTDNIVPISNTIHFSDALDKEGIMFETHIYSYGPHGFSTMTSNVEPLGTKITPRAARWVEDSIAWLKEVLGDFADDGTMTAPAYKGKVNDDKENYLSVDCTFSRIMSVPEGAAVLKPMMEATQAKAAEKYKDNPVAQANAAEAETSQESMGASAQSFIAHMKLRDVLAFGNVPKEMVDQIDQQLRTITIS